MSEYTKTQKTPLFIGDNLALDFINTQFGVGSTRQEYFTDDDAVLAWLKLAGVLPDDIDVAPEGLLSLALQLRENTKCLLSAAKHGIPAEASAVNQVLRTGRPLKELQWDSGSESFKVVSRRPQENAASFLEPIAQAIIDLLTHTPLDLIRKCEAHECTLIFHDKTKSHRRRWCSMALCGNRMKVAAFRSRKKGE